MEWRLPWLLSNEGPYNDLWGLWSEEVGGPGYPVLWRHMMELYQNPPRYRIEKRHPTSFRSVLCTGLTEEIFQVFTLNTQNLNLNPKSLLLDAHRLIIYQAKWTCASCELHVKDLHVNFTHIWFALDIWGFFFKNLLKFFLVRKSGNVDSSLY